MNLDRLFPSFAQGLASLNWLVPLPHLVLCVALLLTAGWGLFLLLGLSAPKLTAIARSTAKESVSQPVYLLAVLVGSFVLLISVWIPYNTLGEDLKMVKDNGLAVIRVLGMLVAIWTAGSAISEEIEGRTALTLLSKPLGRTSFVLGKYLGIMISVFLLILILGAVFMATIAYKMPYDAKETSNAYPEAAQIAWEMTKVSPGLLLSFLQAAMLAAVSVAISTRLPVIPNLVICLAIYALGYMVPSVAQSSAGEIPLVAFVGQLFSVVLPVFQHLDMSTAIATDQVIPRNVLGYQVGYAVLYIAMVMFVAVLLFDDRDLG